MKFDISKSIDDLREDLQKKYTNCLIMQIALQNTQSLWTGI